jgi:hypothetical protein
VLDEAVQAGPRPHRAGGELRDRGREVVSRPELSDALARDAEQTGDLRHADVGLGILRELELLESDVEYLDASDPAMLEPKLGARGLEQLDRLTGQACDLRSSSARRCSV